MTSQEVALKDATKSAVQQFQDEDFIRQLELAAPENVTGRQVARAAATAVLENPDLAKPNLRLSLLRSTLKAAQDGLLPNAKEAAFIVYKVKGEPTIQYLPMVGGLRKIAAEHGWMLEARVIHENDSYDPDYDTHRTSFRRAQLGSDRGKPIGAYALAVHRDGRRIGPLDMDVPEIEKVRRSSRAADRGPWVDWWERMAEKTVARRLFKELPLDPADKRVSRLLADEDIDATDLLYGPAAEVIEGRSVRGRSPQGGSSLPAAAEQAGEEELTANGPDASPAQLIEGEEPSPEMLDALAAADQDEPVEGEADDGDGPWVFPSGMFKGQTVVEAYQSGGRGRQYVKWASQSWQNDEERDLILEALAVIEGDE